VSLRLFADHCVPTSIVQALRESEHEVFALRHHIPVNSPDPQVIDTAQQFESILISLNGDFSDLVAYPPNNYRGIISIQLRNHPEIIPSLIVRLLGFLVSHPEIEYYAGKLLLVEVHRIRIRQ
jgi:predicted nuclease of predicted toxin-antitoxin system